MNILAIADRPPRESIKDLIIREDIDIVCTLGDLDFYSLIELKDINTPKLGVYGNHCSGNYFEGLGIENIHLKTKEINGIMFGGLEGSIRYKENPRSIMYYQEEVEKMLVDFPKVDIFLSHSPPYGIHDEPNTTTHQGFRGLLRYIDLKSPKYLLHGHTYPKKEKTQHKDTKVIYVYQDKVISI